MKDPITMNTAYKANELLDDYPIKMLEEDQLGMGEFVDTMYRYIAYSPTPFVYGVYGEWGTGKTSILNLLLQKLNGKASIIPPTRAGSSDNRTVQLIPIWFNAWEFENELNIALPLLFTIEQEYYLRVGNANITKRARKKFHQLKDTAARCLFDIGIRHVSGYFSPSLPLTFFDVRKHYERSRNINLVALQDWSNNVRIAKDSFKRVFEQFATDLKAIDNNPEIQGYKFVIIIDDLDRCLPDTVIRLLESIKNHLTVKDVIYIMGINHKIVYQGIKHKYNGIEVNGKEYLEKIINYPFYVPAPQSEKVVSYIEQLLTRLFSQSSLELYKFDELVQSSYFNNPRKIKRVMNAISVVLGKNSLLRPNYHDPTIIRLIIIAEYFPDIFMLALRAPVAIQELYQLFSSNIDGDPFAGLPVVSPDGRPVERSKKTIEDFQQKYGIDMSAYISDLMRMRSILYLQSKENPIDLGIHVQTVFKTLRIG